MKVQWLFPFFLLLLLCTSADACRFWLAVGAGIDHRYIVDQLIHEPNSLKKLGETYKDGWSVGFYDHGDEIIIRGENSAHNTDDYDDAVRYIAVLEPEIIMGHLRRASSGCVEGVPNPHPFRVKYNDRTWLFGHNGGIDKSILTELIGPGFLKVHPPAVCNDNPPDSWIDSELFFLLIMKTIKEHDDEIETGITSALKKLYAAIPGKDRYLNFFLSDGKTMWVFRKGNPLYYRFDPNRKMTVIASSIPNKTQEDWIEFPEDTLAVIAPERFPQFIRLE